MKKSRTTDPRFSTLKPQSKKLERQGSRSTPAFSAARGDSSSAFSTFSSVPEGSVQPESEEDVISGTVPAEPVVQVPEAEHKAPATLIEVQNEADRFSENWLARNGHTLTYAGVFLFTLVLYFRPYELFPALAGFQSLALIIAAATLLVYLPSQFTTEGNLTALPIEVKCVLFITAWALLTIPIAKNPGLAWATFNDTFIKVILMFIVMVNTLRTEWRIKGLMWLGIGVGLMLSWQAVDLYRRGEFKTDGYRVSIDFGGMFGNPNDMSIHLVMFIPLAVALGAAASNWIARLFFFACAAIMTAGCFVTQSRGGFLGLIAAAAVLVWKLGRAHRLRTVLIATAAGIVTILLAPGNYGVRILSIFIPSLDPVGSSDQRTELLIRSIVVSLRNPLGIGMGNFELVGTYNLGTHNAFTQVSSELGLLAFAAYMIVLLSPVRKLDVMERRLFAKGELSWLYYLGIGIQASIAGYLVSSFFSSVAYNWYVYYPVAYAIGLRRIYQVREEANDPASANVAGPALAAQHA